MFDTVSFYLASDSSSLGMCVSVCVCVCGGIELMVMGVSVISVLSTAVQKKNIFPTQSPNPAYKISRMAVYNPGFHVL